MTRIHCSWSACALLLAILGLLAGATPAARADLHITTFPYIITGTVGGDVVISNPNRSRQPQVFIGPNAHISGNVTVSDTCLIDSLGHIGGNLSMYNSSTAKIEGGSAGVVKAYNSSYVTIQSYSHAPITLGGVEGYDGSMVVGQGDTLPYVIPQGDTIPHRDPLAGHYHSVTIKYIYVSAEMKLNGADVPNGVYAFGAAMPSFNYCTLGSVNCAGGSSVLLNTVYCTGDVVQSQSAEMDIVNTTILGSVTSQGPQFYNPAWPGNPFNYENGIKIVIHYNSVVGGNIYAQQSAISIQGGTFTGGIYAMGGYIDITGGHFLNGPLSGTPKSGTTGFIVAHGANLVISSSGQLTGNLDDGTAINVPCIGNVELDD